MNNAHQSVRVLYPVSMKVVDKQLSIQGSVVRGLSTAVVPPASPEAARQVVTTLGVEPGQVVTPGSFLGSVGGRPVFLLADYVPFYRDLVIGDSGDDVRQLQKALQEMGFGSVKATGKLDAASQEAIKRIYSGDGLIPPEKPVFRWQDFVQIPGNNGRVVSAAPAASIVTEKNPLVDIQTSPDVIVARAPVLDADKIDPGQSVRLSIAEQTIESTVTSVGPFSEGTSGGPLPGKDVTIALPPEAGSWLLPDKVISVASTLTASPRLSVPVTAVQHDLDGAFVEVMKPGFAEDKPLTGESLDKVPVRVLAQAAGWAAIETNYPLTVGQQVLVP